MNRREFFGLSLAAAPLFLTGCEGSSTNKDNNLTKPYPSNLGSLRCGSEGNSGLYILIPDKELIETNIPYNIPTPESDLLIGRFRLETEVRRNSALITLKYRLTPQDFVGLAIPTRDFYNSSEFFMAWINGIVVETILTKKDGTAVQLPQYRNAQPNNPKV